MACVLNKSPKKRIAEKHYGPFPGEFFIGHCKSVDNQITKILKKWYKDILKNRHLKMKNKNVCQLQSTVCIFV